MKNKLVILTFAVAMLFSCYKIAEACTSILVTRGASKSGATMVSYAADSHTLYGELYSSPRATYPAGTMKKIYEWDTGKFLGEIPEAAQTYSTVGNMNEHQLVITESTWGGLSEMRNREGIMDYGSLIYTTLQRAKTAEEAIDVIADLTTKYGYYSSGESFSIADKNDVWYMELIGKGKEKGISYVAIKLPDGSMSAHANQARITDFDMNDKANVRYSADVIDFAKKMGVYAERDGKFSFSDTYNPLDFGGMRACEARVWSVFRQCVGGMDEYLSYAMGHSTKTRMPLYIFPERKLDVKDISNFMKNTYEGTPMDMSKGAAAGGEELPYRWKPMTYEVDGVTYRHERPIATQQTGFWLVSESRNWLPDEIGGILWWSVDDTGTSTLTPIYSSSQRVPECFAVGNGSMSEYSSTSAFWIVNRVAQFAYLRYNKVGREVKEAANKFLDESMLQVKAIDKGAEELYKISPESARKFVESFSVNRAQEMFTTWVDLDKYLMVKYMDGNEKRMKDGEFETNGQGGGILKTPIMSGYTEAWKRAAAKDAGDAGKEVVPDSKEAKNLKIKW